MDYIRLQNLTNQYPKTGNYIPQLTGEATLFGVYDTINKIDLNFADFSEVIPVPNLKTTRFIVAVTYDESLTKITDSNGDVIDDILDVEKNKINTVNKADTSIDTFANQSKKAKRKKRKQLFGKIANSLLRTALTVSGVSAVVNASTLVADGITRNKKRKKARLSKKLDNLDIPENANTPKDPLLVTRPKKFLDRIIGRKNNKRDRIFGGILSKEKNVSNSSLINPKEPLIGDDNQPKPRIFSDLKIDNESNTTVTKLFCSQLYYDDLINSKTSANPYFVNFSFKPEFMIELNMTPVLELADSLLEKELETGILMGRNNYIEDGGINFEYLMTYIDWVVSKPELAEIDSNGVIPANILCEYERGTFDKKTGKWDIDKIQDSNTSTKEQKDTEPKNSIPKDFPPIGRAGTYPQQRETYDGDEYVWTGTVWRPSRPDNRGNNNSGNNGGSNYGGYGGGSGGYGGSGGSGGGNGFDRRGGL